MPAMQDNGATGITVTGSKPGGGFPWDTVGDLAGQAAGLLFGDGGLFGTNQNKRDREYAAALNNQNAGITAYMNAQNIDMQRETNAQNLAIFNDQQAYADNFNRNQIQWKVEDASKAGIHPLYALGGGGAVMPSAPSLVAPQNTFSPSGGYTTSGGGPDVGAMGQNISRAMVKMLDKEGRARASLMARQQMASNELDLSYKELMNRKLASEIALNERSQIGPPSVDVPNMVTAEGQKGTEAGRHVATGWTKNPDGSFSRTPSMDEKNRIEDMGPLPWIWSYDHLVVPFFDKTKRVPPPSEYLPKNHRWVYKGGKYYPFPNDTKYRDPFGGEQ